MIWVALTFGIISSLHCLVMCGPLQAVVAGFRKRRAGGVRRAADDGAEAAVIKDHRRERARPLGLAEAAR